MKTVIRDLARSYRLHHAGSPGLLKGIGLVGTVAFPLIYLLRFTGKLPPLYDDLPWRLVAIAMCALLVARKSWPQRLQRWFLPFSYLTIFYSLAFFLPFTLLQNQAATPTIINMVVSALLIILLTDWRNSVVLMLGGYATSIAAYWLTNPDPRLPSTFLVWWVPLSAVLVAGGSISKYVEKRAELERMRRLYSGMAGSVAHEMRTPLAHVEHALETIEASLRRAGQPNAPGLSRDELRRLSALAAQGRHAVRRGLQGITVTLQQLSHRAFDPAQFRPLSAAACVHKAVDEYVYEGAHQRSRVRIEVADDFTFIGDETTFVLIVFNLLKNALYYLPLHPDAIITITVERTPEHRVVVRDSGPGIAPELLARLFEEFQSSGKSEGTGLGLAFCRRAMQAFGGNISCRSELGRFTEFALTFPPASPAAQPQSTPAALSAGPQVDLAGRTVLVVDDSAFNRTIVKARLRELGVHALEAQHGSEALRMIDEGARPAAILMDVQMPGLSGMDATRALRARPGPASTIPVLGVSANDLPASRDSALAAGMDGYLTKPLQPELLRAELERVLRLAASNEPFQPSGQTAGF
ncbi:hybrid sensor histidine kinase/response regulator [Ramlibacter sp. AN1133]|uniref:hybrid sensor histidine kinase/response regulator n=1 Tax=Ramlibacter sp. AN1133 TaxID=3133429 RepID=UPI0030BE267F